ncbi:MAG: amidohydrolase family protein [Desulfobacterales bacterium]|nr:amidohydrolase family protein [Desulfobacterales bacterium]
MRRAYEARAKIPARINPEFLRTRMPKLADFEQSRLPDMDRYNIQYQVLSTSPPGIQGLTHAGEAVSMAKKINDAQANILARYAGRFGGLAALPLQDPRAASDELERAVTQLGFKGACVHGHTNGEYFDQEEFFVLWERAEALGVPVYLHPIDPPPDQIKMYGPYPQLLGASWGWLVETATHALRVVCAGVFDRFPKATVVLGHLGEMLPFILDRLDQGCTQVKMTVPLKKPMSAYVRENMVVSTSSAFAPEALRCTIDALSADRVMFATDYPFVSTQDAVRSVEAASLTKEEKEKIYWSNAAKLLQMS